MFKKFDVLTKMEKGSLIITGIYAAVGAGLMVYGSIKEKQVLREFRDAVIQREINKIKAEDDKTNRED